MVVGEVGLTGEVRPISSCDRLVNEAYKMGFKNVIIPYKNKANITLKEMNIMGISSLKESIGKIF
jgi:DNA repair protein RadA/Sms